MANALSRREVITYITTLSEVIFDFNEKIKQMDKTGRKKAIGLLQPLPFLEKPWESISMDFITGFPKKNWVDLLDTAQLCYNLHRSSATGMSPFELAIGVQPRMPLEVAKQKAGGNSPVTYKMRARHTLCAHRRRARCAPLASQTCTTCTLRDTQTTLEHAHMGSTTCAWCGLPLSRVGTRAPKPCASEPAEEAMGAMPWPDGALDRKLTHTMMPTHNIGAQCPVH
ncbi:hypothetical protein AAG906_013154 [Vitis piasezkii]